MEVNYKLHQIREIAGGDESFIPIIIEAFLEEVPEAVQLISEGLSENDHNKVYQNAHKIKPTVQQFEISIYEELIVVQDWGKFKQESNVTDAFERLQEAIAAVVVEMKTDFDL